MPAEEILRGGEAIARAIGLPRRTVYHHALAGRLPVFRLGSTLCAKRSSLTAWLAEREAEAAAAARAPAGEMRTCA